MQISYEQLIRGATLSGSKGSDPARGHLTGGPSANPWLAPVPAPRTAPPPPPRQPPQIQPLAPQPGVAAPDLAHQLQRRVLLREELLGVWFVLGVHGGAGESTLEALLPAARAADHTWPLSPDPRRPARVLLVARTSHSGLLAAQHALRDWASGAVTAELLGLVLMADAPGRLPKQLRLLAGLVASAAPRIWKLPWQAQWRLGQPTLQRASRELQQLVHQLNHPQEAQV